MVLPADRLLIVEGTWLLLAAPPRDALAPPFDLTIMLTLPKAEIDRRLQAR
ncbi:MAG: hypothetical protein ACK4L4_00805 [Gemmobacter sp.]